MTASTIQFELVSPQAKLMSGPVQWAVIPGVEGEMGVGAGHAAFVVSLKPGVVKLYSEGEETPRQVFIAGGFADVTGGNCTVLAEEAVNVNDINASETEQDVKNLKEDLGIAQDAAEIIRITRQLAIGKARLQAVTGKLVL